MIRPPPSSPLFPSPPLSRSSDWQVRCDTPPGAQGEQCALIQSVTAEDRANVGLTVIVLKTADQKSRLLRVVAPVGVLRSEEHTSELQSRLHLVCRLLLEKKK